MSRKKHVRPTGDEDIKIYPDVPPTAGFRTARVPAQRIIRYTAGYGDNRNTVDREPGTGKQEL